MDIADYYADPKNCTDEILLARKVMTNMKSTIEEWDGVQKALTFMFFYAPDEIKNTVEATFDEFRQRRYWMEMNGHLPVDSGLDLLSSM